MESHELSGQENVPVSAVSKEGHADSLLGHERIPSLLISLKMMLL